MTALSTSRRPPAVALLLATAGAVVSVAGTVPAAAAVGQAAAAVVQAAPARARAVVTPAPVVGGPRLGAPGVVVDLPPGVPRPPAMKATSYVVADLGSGAVLVAKAAHARHLPASALKSLTALTLLPRLNPAAVVRAEPSDLVDGSKVGLSPGSRYTNWQLLQGMMLSSGNDAATALARGAGGVPQSVGRMQAEALALGARDTVVRNPSGLDAPGQVTSAYDLALFARAGMRLPAFRQLVATRRVVYPGREVHGKRRPGYEIQNHNRLLANYPGAIGVKNGYTVAARWSVSGAATRGGRTYVVTALGRTDGSWRPTAALLDWAFAHGTQARPVGRLVDRGEPLPAAAPAAATPPSAPPAPGGQQDGGRQGGEQVAADPTGQPAAAQPVAARSGGTGLGRRAAVGALALAALGALLLVLTAPARRRRLHAARLARRGPRPPR